MAADGPSNKFQGLTSLLNIRFFNDFFFKRFSKSYWSGNPIDPNIGPESKKLSESVKSDTKAGKILAHLYPKKGPNRAKSYYSFQWKFKGDRALIHLNNLINIFDFGHFQEVNWGQVGPKTLKTLRTFKNSL